MIRTFYVTLSFITLLWTAILNAEVRIEITQGLNTARPIGILPFQWIGRREVISEDLGKIISADLRNSGKFIPLDQSKLSHYPMSLREIKSFFYNTLGIDTIVIGQLKSNVDGSYQVEYQLLNINDITVEILEQDSVKVSKILWLRCAAHTVSDEIFEQLTGIKGAFRTRIAYVAKNDNSPFPYELCITDYDGYNKFVIHRSTQPLMSPAWSPDGNNIAYVTFESGRSVLIIQTLNNAVIQTISSYACHNGAPAFSPDGSKLVFALSKTGSLNLYIIDLKSKKIQQITNGSYNNTEPTWFPDNHTLAYTSDQSGMPQIYKIDINIKIPERLTWQGVYNQNANISSDGKTMVMISSDNNGIQHVAKQDLETGDITILTSTFLDETPNFSPNNVMIIYRSIQGDKSVIQLISTDGYFKAYLPTVYKQITFPVWSPYL
ncbi:Tol-Pal system beta propeller repeat protein TolB [Pantoea sp. Mhis]|uniref:Tol-Pal system beta propeller repeat protein TolB n=1 Tax=Pantoea sp. Mhis TaxID=2576759 RepID=UPI00135763E2|nr:Tol-Pal system beta propeller repeat protein TolB [Pantoea sp. Mhis]MXP56293.1 Tol-Pal system protein TolB [Pantoea sp. Mhis]